MLDISPVLQFKNTDGKNILIDSISKNIFEIDDFDDLKFILDIMDFLPNTRENIKLELNDLYDDDYVDKMIDELLLNGIMHNSSIINSLKVKVQEWVDNGWSDALILHLASRNIKYVDDPVEFGGDGDLENIPYYNAELMNNEYISEYKLNDSVEKINPNEIINAIKNRRSFQPFVKNKIEIGDLDLIFWYSNQYIRNINENFNGLTKRDKCFDSSFSALESYLVLYKKTDVLEQGVYHYDKEKHSLKLIKKGDFKKEMSELAIGQRRASSGLFSIIITGDWLNYSKRYNHERSYRNLLINTSQLAQYYLIISTHKKYNSFITPAILDEKLYYFLDLKEAYPLYITTYG
ncbi:SagB/ThcOx family dehydrogenase [Acinetobacter higginsii]|uniref:SagB/ThcOx family dehydrogenase n=1 Tax=Acinetobacter higginsii TaxID=70347 RepID=UPI002674463D|nr:SagB/ThcOx family dehydrogenase [Acinetobacter higginsii]MDO3664901.1 SagB/ThcOx family dehydrogenase [Acinetobacter higginsii]